MRPAHAFRRCFIASCAAALLAVPASAQVVDQWTNLTGTRTVTGEMIGMWNDRVLLKLSDGRRVAVRKEDLRAESRIQADQRFEQLQQRMQESRDLIRSAAAESESPGPEVAAGQLQPPPAYVAPEPGEGLRATLVAIRDQTLAGHLRIFYDTMPASHQQLLGEVAATGLDKVDPASYELARTTLRDLAELVVSRQRWLMSHPRFAQIPEASQPGLIEFASVVRVLTADELLGLPAVRSRPLAESIAAIDEALAPHLFRLFSENSALVSMMAPDFEVQAGEGDRQQVALVTPMLGTVGGTTFIPLEGRWVTGTDAAAATTSLQETLTSLKALPDESLRLPDAAQTLLQQLAESTARLQQATTRQQFHRTLDELLPQWAAGLGQLAGSDFARSALGRAGGGPFAGEMTPEMQMEMEMRMEAERERAAEAMQPVAP